MKALVIAAGRGSRLRSVSDSKPLTPVAGVPLIEHVIAAAAAAGVRDFVVATGHAAERVESFLGALAPRLGVAIDTVRVPDWSLANGHSVLAGAERIEGEHLLMMADHLFDPAIMARLLEAPKAPLLLAVDREVGNPRLDLADATKVELAPDGGIARIGKTLDSFNAIDTGLFRATPALVEGIRADIGDGGEGSLSAGVQRLAEKGEARAVDVTGTFWIDVDDPTALRAAEAALAPAGRLTGTEA